MPSQQISGQDASSACRRPPSAGRRGKVPEPGHKPQDPEGKTSSSSPAKVVQTQQRMTIRQQQQIEAMLEPEPRLREGLPPPAPPALQRATVDGKRDAKTRHTQGARGPAERQPQGTPAQRRTAGRSSEPNPAECVAGTPHCCSTDRSGGRPRAAPAPVPTPHADSRRGAGDQSRSADTAGSPGSQQYPRRSGSGTARHDGA